MSNKTDYSRVFYIRIIIILTLLLFHFTAIFAQSGEIKVRIGVRAHLGVEKALEKWGPTAGYLSDEIPGYLFEIVPVVSIEKMLPIVERGEVDFVLTNPAHYVELEAKFGVTRVATLKNLRQGKPYVKFGGVIFCKADRNDIHTLNDLKDKTFMAVAERAFGGWWMSLREFKKNSINPFNDFKNISFGITQDRVVFAVRDGEVDAGSVRTDMLERMAANGEIDLKAFRVLNQKHIKNFPFLLSTDVYPEWPFAKSSHTSNALSRLVTIALFNMPDYSNAAIAGKNAGWTVPLDYSPVHELMKDLRVGPYEHFGKVTIGDFLRQYFYWLAAVIVIVLALAVIIIYIGNLNGKIKQELLRRKKMEEQIKASLKEKEMLLREIHHRVKNNMQVVSCLLMLQSEYLNDEKDIELFKESQNRIKSMAIIHENLYQSEDLAKIDFKVYVKNLSDELLRSYSINGNKIALKIDIKAVSLGIETAIPCSLIINELISNSIKYAFPFDKLRAGSFDSAQDRPDTKKCEIKISMSKKKDGEIEMIVADNGVSMPKGLNFRNTKTLGLQLVTGLAENQLDGKIELNISKGTEFRIRFKELQDKKRI